jgi:hypothetical protein
MEKDIDVLIEVDPDEADLLLRLIEGLLEEWYIRRYERQDRMNKIIAAAAIKQDERHQGPP